MKSRKHLRETFAAARDTSKAWKPGNWRPRGWPVKKPNPPRRLFMAGNNGGKRGLRVVGKPFVKVDAKAKCIGELKYADDLFLPRMLHTKLLRSTVPHARIISIDVSKAKAYPGVHAVLTGADLPPISAKILPSTKAALTSLSNSMQVSLNSVMTANSRSGRRRRICTICIGTWRKSSRCPQVISA